MRARAGSPEGYTLLELLLTCTILGVVLAAAVPNLRSYRESQRMQHAGQQVAAACRTAQSRARSENHSIVIEYRPVDNAFAIVDDENENGQADAGESLTLHPLPEGSTLQATTFTNDRLLFDKRGRVVQGGRVVVAGRDGVQPKTVTIAAGTGQVRVRGGSGS